MTGTVFSKNRRGRPARPRERTFLELRQASGLTLMAVSERTGISAPRLSMIERGRAIATVGEARELGRLFGVRLELRALLVEVPG